VHQAAWHGADAAIVHRLLRHGAWLTLRAASGDRSLDIALRSGHLGHAELLMPTIHTPVTDALAALQRDMWFAVPGMYGGFHYVLQGRNWW
jgi:hypothetical protein